MPLQVINLVSMVYPNVVDGVNLCIPIFQKVKQ